ncbi:MAG: CBS domain-containing protein [Spirochaetales bacterium]|nr:CBS domain-containing protein [Leptospiraceae bacterium]MCP5481111.1 CBS domain-containing protein [Spirochaetales bacterium]
MKRLLEDKRVSEVMQEGVFTARVDQTWGDAARRMLQKSIHHLVIVDSDHKPLGVLSSMDFLGVVMRRDQEFLKKPLSDSRPERKPLTIQEDQHLYEAANLMDTHHVECLVVLSRAGGVKGVITPKDIMNGMFEDGYQFS